MNIDVYKIKFFPLPGIHKILFVQVKNNKLSYDAVIKQVDVMFPVEMRNAVKAAATHCKDVGKSQLEY